MEKRKRKMGNTVRGAEEGRSGNVHDRTLENHKGCGIRPRLAGVSFRDADLMEFQAYDQIVQS